VQVTSPEKSVKKSVFDLPRMDCASEERLVRMALDGLDQVARLGFDLGRRRLTVVHLGDPDNLLKRLAPLNFGARLVETGEAELGRAKEVAVPVEEHRTLRVLLAINAAMFFVEIVTGLLAESTGLIADSLDMFADAAVYSVSLYAVGKDATMQMRSARFSGYLQLILAFGALFEVIRRFLVGSDPEPPLMIGIAFLALVANVTCMALIAKHRQGGAHMRASWIFSTNDVIANVGVILAGALVAWTGSHLPDLAVGAIIALIVLSGAIRILRLSGMPYRTASEGTRSKARRRRSRPAPVMLRRAPRTTRTEIFLVDQQASSDDLGGAHVEK
jgi:Co/Zn/Cd efflux system component